MNPEDGEPGRAGRARQTFKQLKTRWGVELTDLDWKKPPILIVVRAMDDIETWKQWQTAGEPAKPDQVEYELIEVRRANGPA